MSKSWDQRGDESDAAYGQFQKYLLQGPGRATARVMKGAKGRRPSGAIQRLSAQFKWVVRARAYDIEQFQVIGHESILEFVRAMGDYARHIMDQLPKVKFRTPGEIAEAFHVLSSIIPPETLAAMYATPTDDFQHETPCPQDGAQPGRPYKPTLSGTA